MFTWKRSLQLLAIVVLSMWLSYLYFKTNSSPLLVWSKWVTAVEQGDAITIERLSEWNGKSVDHTIAKKIINTLHRNPEWKYRVYHELQQQAVKLVRKDRNSPSNEIQPWFQLTRKAGKSTYKVNVPSFYFSVVGSQNSLLLSIDQQLFTVEDRLIGPFVAADTDVQLIYQHKIGDIEEQYKLRLSELWGENEIQLLPTSLISAFTIHSNYAGGDLFIDDHYAGKIRTPSRIEPLSYDQHELRIERTLPWGLIQSEIVVVPPDQKEVQLPLTLVNEDLIEQLGETLIQYNLSWSTAVSSGDPSKFEIVTPELRQQLRSVITGQTGKAQFAGNFMQVLIDTESIELTEPSYQHFEVKLIAREDYAAGRWEDEDGNVLATYEPQRYWEYQLQYTPDSGWQVANYSEITRRQANQSDWKAFHAQRVLRIGIDAGLPPFEWIRNGELYGFDVEFMQWLGQKMNVQIIFEERPWNQIVNQFDLEGDLDGAISAIDTNLASEMKNVLISEPYYTDEGNPHKSYVIVLRKDLGQLYQKINELLLELHSEYILEYDEMRERYF